MTNVAELKRIASQVRRDIIRMVANAKSGHPGGSLGCTDFMVALYFGVMEHDPKKWDMDGKNQDLFFLSNGHICPVWYSVLSRSGYFEPKELATFRKIDSRLQGHPTPAEHIPGVRTASGSLGQGLSVALGAAQSKKLNNDNNLVFTLHGDGEIQEGQIWEAAIYAAGKKVDNLIATIDYNGQQIDGPVNEVMPLGDLKAKWLAFGWDVLECDGNNMQEILNTILEAKKHTGKGKPVCILMRTEMGMGVDFMVGTHKWHGKAPNKEETEKALAQLEMTIGDF